MGDARTPRRTIRLAMDTSAPATGPAAAANPGGAATSAAGGGPFSSLHATELLNSVVALLPADDLQERIDGHKAERAAIQKQKKEVTTKIRNEKKKRTRLMKKSNALKSADLLEILRSRQEAAAKKAQRTAQ